MNVDRGDAEIRSAAHSERSSRKDPQIPLPQGLPTRDQFTDSVSTVKTVEQTHAGPNRDQDQASASSRPAAFGTGTAAIMGDMFTIPLD